MSDPSGKRLVTHVESVLGLYTGGSARLEMNGEWSLTAGDVFIVPAGEAHRMIDRRDARVFGVAVPAGAPLFERVRDGAAAVVRVPGARQAFLETLFQEWQSAEHASEAVRDSLLTLMLAEVERGMGTTATSKPSVVREALRFIERNCLRPITLEEVAAAVGRSPAHLTHTLTKETGRSARQWIIAGRMAEARRLLQHSTESVEAIAFRVGYADPTHFIRMFRREHGVTPAAWRTNPR